MPTSALTPRSVPRTPHPAPTATPAVAAVATRGLTHGAPTAEALAVHEAACDSCWSLEDARTHLCGDEDPVTHRSSTEEVA